MNDFDYLKQIEEELNIKLTSISAERDYLLQAKSYRVDEYHHVIHLNLSHCNIGNLNRVIKQLSALTNLSMLFVGHNQVSDLGPLVAINNLTMLDVYNNNLRDLGPLSNLTQLKHLTLSGNYIYDLVPISKCTKLSYLNLSSNQVLDLCPLSKLTELIYLDVSVNQINDLGPLVDLTNLSWLKVRQNNISYLGPISRLLKLFLLDISYNQVSNLDSLSHLNHLKNLELSRNPIKVLKPWISDFKMEIQWNEGSKDNYITFFANPLETPPPEIVKQGKEAVKNYFRQLQEQDIDYLFEAKLLIVGEPGAGKTTLARKLEKHDSPLPDEDDTTLGIDVKPNYFPLRQEDVPELDGKKIKGKEFRMNIWDFGGQEIYKATHRFFLSNRSLYVLVVDNRREDTDFNYWLHVIEMFGGSSPLLIVSNEKQQRKRDIDVGVLQQRFTNISDILAVDFAEPDKERLCRLEQAIKYEIKRLSHIGSPVPARWTSVRKLLDEEQHHTISRLEYLALCEAEGIEKKEDALVLSQYFHDIGVFLHFQDDSLLNKIIFLKPNWATHAVYKMLDHSLLDKQHGRFSRDDVETIWHEEEYTELRDELVRLMQKFFLTYEIEGSGCYIVPEKLPSARPEYTWDSTGNLYLQYAYDLFMPKGIMSQFVVEMHRYISNHDLVWKRGCLLERDGAVAEVIESYDARRIAIRLSGKNKRDFMTIIAEKLDGINLQYEKMKVDKLIPCNCFECIGSENPFFYNYADLKRRIEQGKLDVECGNSYEPVNVRQLIDDVFNEKPIHHKPVRNVLSEKTKVFVSYARTDEKYLKRLQTHILAANNIGIDIDGWDDTRINAGDRWRHEIEDALDCAKVGVLLVSTDFLASDFIMNSELPALLKSAEKNGTTIFSLIIKPSLYKQSELAMFQAINNPDENFADLSPAEQDKRYLKLIDSIAKLI